MTADPIPEPRATEGRKAFHAAILALLATDEGDEWWWCDPDFADWPLDDPVLVQSLTRWLARPGRQLTLLACDFESLVRRHPRFVDWRRYHAHRVLGRSVAIDASQMPTMLLGGAPNGLQLLDRQRYRAVRIDEGGVWREAREIVDALFQQSTPSFAARVLGL
jgi:hypothetical protein